ncbi:hypothetical protein ABIB25_000198 [Nakamurella sp. UYEF19]|uniref:hypothetical protein n=1 Tax=Nakamurella sp. UYEF19 TaxID=1756392 RepID=UPI0033908FB7
MPSRRVSIDDLADSVVAAGLSTGADRRGAHPGGGGRPGPDRPVGPHFRYLPGGGSRGVRRSWADGVAAVGRHLDSRSTAVTPAVCVALVVGVGGLGLTHATGAVFAFLVLWGQCRGRLADGSTRPLGSVVVLITGTVVVALGFRSFHSTAD